MLKWLVVLVVAGAAGVGIWYAIKNHNGDVQYQTAPVTRGDIIQSVTASGQLNPVVNIQVGSQISGRISKLFVDYNSQVKSNQVIAEIDPATFQASVRRAEADLANAKANLSLAQVQARRAESLFTNNLISASDHDTALAQAEQAGAMVQSAEAAVANAGVDLSRCTIVAPVDGVVISRNVDVGQTVAASFNTPTLFLIANDLTKMQIDALVSEADIGGVEVGQNVNFSVDAYPYRTFHGKVSQLRFGALTNQNVVNYDCVISVDNSDQKLLPGMTASVSVIIAERDGVIKVPSAALRFHPPEPVPGETNVAPRLMADAGPAAGGEGGARSGGDFRNGGKGGGTGQDGAPGGGSREAMGGGEGKRGPRASGGPGGPGGPGGSGGGPGAGAMRPRPERSGPRTVYLLGGTPAKPALTPTKIRTGITDAANVEVSEGLKEGDQVVVGLLTTTQSGSQGRPSNPFGGGGFRRGF